MKNDANSTEIQQVADWLRREEQRIEALGLGATVGNMKAA
jgi:hypothetical protein